LSIINTIHFRNGQHSGIRVIHIYFPYNKEIIAILKSQTSAIWSKTQKCWNIPEDDFDFSIVTILERKYNVDISGLEVKTSVLLPKGYLEKLLQKQYSENTIKIYCHYFEKFMIAFSGRKLEEITHDEINAYILRLIQEKKISRSQQNQRINAIKFYYEHVLNSKKAYFDIDRPRKDKKLPNVLSKKEIGSMLKVTTNLKHKCIIALIYSYGLRRSEAIYMKLEDIDSKRMMVKIKGAKGNKDRYGQLSIYLLKMLRGYYKEYKPTIYLFEGQNKQHRYSGESITQVIKQAAQKAGIKKRVYPHILRHSFATHHLEQGTDLRYIQELLGHASIKTTEIYTHVAQTSINKLKNPLDEIFE